METRLTRVEEAIAQLKEDRAERRADHKELVKAVEAIGESVARIDERDKARPSAWTIVFAMIGIAIAFAALSTAMVFFAVSWATSA